MLEGVFSASKESQLNEFIQIERTLETEESDIFQSEPGICSYRKTILAATKPPTGQQAKSDQ